MNKPSNTKFTIDECYLMMFSEYDDIITADEAASMLRLPKKRVYRMFRSGELKSFKDGRDVRTCKLWIIEYVQRYGFIHQERFRKQRKAAVTVFCQEPKSRKQIQEFLDLADKRFFMESVLQPLVAEGTLVDQTHLQNVLRYIESSEKTAKRQFVTGINCMPDTATEQMVMTKMRYGKTDGTVAFHGYQSFRYNEATPELAHQIGVQMAREIWVIDSRWWCQPTSIPTPCTIILSSIQYRLRTVND